MFVLLYFAATLFTSATLLFFVQPMIGKMILPRLGGTPAVWNTCMVFFQAVLLLGYGYTHFVSKLPKRRQLVIQAALLLMPLAMLPFSLGEWMPPADSNPVFSVLGILTVVVGVPFFVVSTTAPLLQKWFALTEHPSSKDPYFLYGASNLGSMLALVLYPVAMEPNFSLEPQTWIWFAGYGLFAALVLGSIVMVWAKTAPPVLAPAPSAPAVASDTAIAVGGTKRLRFAGAVDPIPDIARGISWPRRLRWIALAAIPSGLMLGCTTYMTTDIAAIPFFWVLPLAMYLFTFVLVFARWPVVWTAPAPQKISLERTKASFLILGAAVVAIVVGLFVDLTFEGYHLKVFDWPHLLYIGAFFLFFVYWIVSGTGGAHDFVLYFQPCFLLFLVLILVVPQKLDIPTWLEFTLHLLAFFFITLMCHGELAADRPPTEHLTEFYLCMSVGGVSGGLFNAILAPLVFRWGIVEYPLAMVASCFLRPNLAEGATLFPGDNRKDEPTPLGYALDAVLPITLGASMLLAMYVGDEWGYKSFLMAIPIVGVLAMAMRPVRFGLALTLVWCVVAVQDRSTENWIFRDRGFFGVVKVRQNTARESGRTYNTLIHGGIDHGRQHVDRRRRHEPCAYFHPLTGIGQLFMKLSWPNTDLPKTYEEFSEPNNPYHNFTLPNWRMPASLVGMGTDPFSALVTMHSEPPFAVLGLGTGTLAAFAKPYQSMDIYEIDPLVLSLSRKRGDKDPPFTYVMDAEARGANLKVILGDGRKKIEKASEQWYHVICLDAFASDAIPVHLLTVEAIQTYLDKLAPGGVLVFNTTNKYVDIAGVLKDSADHLGLECTGLSDWWGEELVPEKYGTDFVMLRRSQKAIDALGTRFNGGPSLNTRLDEVNWKLLMTDMRNEHKKQEDRPGWRPLSWRPWRAPANLNGELWTDKYSNLLGVLRLGP